jgi:hypothetical protein
LRQRLVLQKEKEARESVFTEKPPPVKVLVREDYLGAPGAPSPSRRGLFPSAKGKRQSITACGAML